MRIVLIGGGHSHVEVLRRFAAAPVAGAELVLVSPDAATPYSGMLPGLVAGHYTFDETHIELGPLAAAAGARFVRDRVVALDLGAQRARLAAAGDEPYDLASLDVGSTPDLSVPGAREHAVGVKPVAAFLEWWRTQELAAGADALRSITVVGGGAGGVELLLAMQFRLADRCRGPLPSFHLVSSEAQLLARHAGGVGRWLARRLAERDVALTLAAPVTAVLPGTLVIGDGRRLPADRIVFVTGAAAAPWLAASGLACDASGFVAVDAHLRSTSHPCVFAAGDCAVQQGFPRPKSGVYAVRQGPPLAANLRAAALGLPLAAYAPQRRALALVSAGDRRAIASYGPLTVAGHWVWRWKDRIDRRFMARYRHA